MAPKQEHKDASLDPALNGITVNAPKIAARAGVEPGAVVAWAVAFPRPELTKEGPC